MSTLYDPRNPQHFCGEESIHLRSDSAFLQGSFPEGWQCEFRLALHHMAFEAVYGRVAQPPSAMSSVNEPRWPAAESALGILTADSDLRWMKISYPVEIAQQATIFPTSHYEGSN